MSGMTSDLDIGALRQRLENAEALVEAIREGEVDAVVVNGPDGERIYTLSGAERPYRAFVEAMRDGAVTLGPDETILFANRAFSALVQVPLEQIVGRPIGDFTTGWSPDCGRVNDELVTAQLRTASGDTLPVALSCREVAVDGRSFTAVVVADRSDHVQMRALRDRETHLNLLLDAAHALTFEWDIVQDRVRRLFSREAALPATADEGDAFAGVKRVVHPEDRARFQASVDAALSHADGLYASEHRVVRPDGEVRWRQEAGRVEFDEASRPVRLLGISYDVTRRVNAARRERERDLFMRTVLECTPDLVWAKDASGQIILGNQATFDLLGGGDRERVIGRGARELIPDNGHAQAVLDNDARIMATGRPELVEELFGSPDAPRVFETRKSPLRDASGQVVGLVGVSRDVTEAREVQQELRDARERYQRATRIARTCVYDLDLIGGTAVAYGLPDVLGYADGPSLTTASWFERMHSVDRPVQQARFDAWVASGGRHWAARYRVQHADGDWRDVEDTAEAERLADGRVARIVGTIQDVTERRRAETAAADRTQQLDLLARLSSRLLIAAEPESELLTGVFRELGQTIGMEAYYHYRPVGPRVLGLHLADGISTAERAGFENIAFGEHLCGRVAERQTRLIIEDLPHTDLEGAEALTAAGVMSYAGFPLLARGELLGTLGFVSRARTHFRDGAVQTIQAVCDLVAATLDRRRLIDTLRDSESTFRAMFEVTSLGKVQTDASGRLQRVNQAYCQMTGYSEADLLGMTFGQLTHPADRDHELAEFQRMLTGESPALALEERCVRRDGRTIWVRVDANPSRDNTGRVIRSVAVVQDVTARRTAEAEKQQFVSLAEAATDAIGIATLDGRVRYLNPAAQQLVGLESFDPSQPWDVARFYPADEHRRLRDTAWASIRAARWEGEVELQHAITGERIAVQQKAFLLPAAQGPQSAAVATIVVDIRERKQVAAELAESEERFRRMADETPVAMWVTDQEGSVDFVNAAYCKFFGVSLDQVQGPNWQPLVHPDDNAYVTAFAAAVSARAPFHAAARVRRHDGEWRWIESTGQPRFGVNGAFLGMIGVSPDVTEQRMVATAQEEAARQKDEFIAVLAHELRNPLAPIRTSVGILRARGPLDPALVTCRDVIDRQVTQMARLLDDLLDVSRLSRGTLTLNRQLVRLRDVLDTAIETAAPVIDEQHHRLTRPTVDEAIVLEADGARLTQIFANLLNNAAKYTPPGGDIRLEVRTDPDAVVIMVHDTGIGIEPAMRDRVFDLFAQAHGGRHHPDGGLGIGLGLTKRLVEMHGGTVTVESRGRDHGSTFSVRLPLQREQAGASNRAHESARGAPSAGAPAVSHRVLVVDDNVDAADTLALLLETEHCDVRAVYDGEAALEAARVHRPDLVLLDLGMPGLDGATVCRRLRDASWASRIVIVAVTGWGQAEDRRRTKTAGFDEHLVKPVSPEVLAQLVRNLPPPTDA